MARQNCPACGSPITFAAHEGQRIPLDTHEVMKGEHRYVRRAGGLAPVAADANVYAYTDHRKTCSRRRK